MSLFDLLSMLAGYNYPFKAHPALPPILTAIFAFFVAINLASRKERLLSALCASIMIFLGISAAILAFRPYSSVPYLVEMVIGILVILATVVAGIGRLVYGFAMRQLAWWPKVYLVASCLAALVSMSFIIVVEFSIGGFVLSMQNESAQRDAFGVLVDVLSMSMGANVVFTVNLIIAAILCYVKTAIRRKRSNRRSDTSAAKERTS